MSNSERKRNMVSRIKRIGAMMMASGLVFLLVSASCLTGYGASLPKATYDSDDQTQWTMGYNRNVNGMSGVQGKNGWYALYTKEHNKNGNINVGGMSTLTYGTTSNKWKSWVRNNWEPKGLSKPEDSWWLSTGNGEIRPDFGGPILSGAYAWAAPKDAVYSVSVDYEAGGRWDDWGDERYYSTDGVTLSVNTKSGAKAVVDCPAANKDNNTLTKGTISKKIHLNKGEAVYFIVDPQNDGTYAYCVMSINIQTTEDEKDDEGIGNGSGEEEGNGTGDEPVSPSPSSNNGKPGQAGGKGESPNAAPSTPETQKNDPVETVEDSNIYIINAKDLEEQSKDEEEAMDAEDGEGGDGETEDPLPDYAIPVFILGMLELVGGGVVFSIGRFYWANKM